MPIRESDIQSSRTRRRVIYKEISPTSARYHLPMAFLRQLRHAPSTFRGTTRLISSSSTIRAEVSSSLNTGTIQPQQRPVGGFRGGYVRSLFTVARSRSKL